MRLARSFLVLATAVVVASFALPEREAQAQTAPAPTVAPPHRGMRSPFALGMGIFLSGAGTAGLAVGGYFFNAGSGSCDGISRDALPSESQVDACVGGVNSQAAGIIGLVTGGAFLAAGIPLIIAGALPEDEAPHVSLSVGPMNGSLRVSF